MRKKIQGGTRAGSPGPAGLEELLWRQTGQAWAALGDKRW